MPNLIELVDMPVWILLILGVIALLAEFIKVLTSIWGFVAPKIFKVKTRQSRQKDFEEAVVTNQEAIKKIREDQEQDRLRSQLADKEIREDLNNTNKKLDSIENLVLNMRIENMRKTLLGFASDVASGKPFTKEQYDEMFMLYADYEDLLEERDMTNGRVEISMEIVKDTYKKYLASGSEGFIENKIPEFKERINKNDYSNVVKHNKGE